TFAGFFAAVQSATFSGATVTFTPDAILGEAPRTLTVSAGSVNLNGAVQPTGFTVQDLHLAGGTLTGSTNITITRLFLWSGGTLSGSGTTDVNFGMIVSGGATLGRTLNINLTAEILGPSASLTLSAGAVLNNRSRPGTAFFIDDGGNIFGPG